MRRKIVTLCGSTRFYNAFQTANFNETMAGNIVLTVGAYVHARFEVNALREVTEAEKARLDELHFDKIAMSHEIFVLNVDGYVGESTRNEIALAVLLGKSIRWLEPDKGGDEWLEREAHDLGKRVFVHSKNGRG